MTLFFQELGGTTARNIISHCGVSKTQEKPTGKCFVPENDVKIEFQTYNAQGIPLIIIKDLETRTEQKIVGFNEERLKNAIIK